MTEAALKYSDVRASERRFAVTEIELKVRGETADVFDGSERGVAVVIQRPYVRQVYVP